LIGQSASDCPFSIVGVFIQEFPMLLSANSGFKVEKTADTGKIRLGGACRLPINSADIGKICNDDARHPPVSTADTGKIRLGGACRLPAQGAQ
jgi:hypothetical protein